MKRIARIIPIIGLMLLLSACGQKNVGMPNPNLYDVGKDAMVQATGIDISAPENAQNVQYSVICAQSDNPMSEVTFTIDGREYCYRAQVASEKIPLGDYMQLMDDEIFEYANISGIYTTWKTKALVPVGNLSGVLATDNKYTVLVWHDAVPGIMYNLSTDEKLSIDEQEDMYNLASSIFVSAQGDS